jgi:hypothetical protein
MRVRSFALSEMSKIFGSCLEGNQPRATFVQNRISSRQNLIPSKTRQCKGARKIRYESDQYITQNVSLTGPYLTFQSLMVTWYTNRFKNQQLYVMPTLHLCILYLSDHKQRLMPLHHKLVGFITASAMGPI